MAKLLNKKFFNFLINKALYYLQNKYQLGSNGYIIFPDIVNNKQPIVDFKVQVYSISNAEFNNTDRSQKIDWLKFYTYHLGISDLKPQDTLPSIDQFAIYTIPTSLNFYNIIFLLDKKLELDTRELKHDVDSFYDSFAFQYLIDWTKEVANNEFATEEDLIHGYTDYLSNLLLPSRVKIKDGHWKPFLNGFKKDGLLLTFSLSSQYNVSFDLFLANDSTQRIPYETLKQELFINVVEKVYQNHFLLWKSKQSNQINISTFSQDLKKYQHLLSEVVDYHKTQEEQLKLLGNALLTPSPAPIITDYEFYKGTSDWVIRFEGKHVKMKRKNETGLRYIHKLMENPGKIYYANELELISNERNNMSSFKVSESISVEVESRFSKLNPDSEKEMLKSLKLLLKEKPGDFDSYENHIYYLSQVVYLANTLKNIVSKTAYIELYNSYKQELDDKIFEFKQETDDKDFVRRILTKSRVIKKPIEHNVQNRRLRQRVTKSVKNALHSMDSEAIQAYLSQTLNIGVKSSFHPLSNRMINWRLTIE